MCGRRMRVLRRRHASGEHQVPCLADCAVRLSQHVVRFQGWERFLLQLTGPALGTGRLVPLWLASMPSLTCQNQCKTVSACVQPVQLSKDLGCLLGLTLQAASAPEGQYLIGQARAAG